jgi:hypothetical protein
MSLRARASRHPDLISLVGFCLMTNCLRLASALPWSNPMRYQLLLMAEDLRRCEKELEGRASPPHDVGEECRTDPKAPAVKREAEEDWGR